MDGVELIVFILTRGGGDTLIRLAADEGILFRVMLRGRGTVSSEILHILGLADAEKDVVLLSVEASRAQAVMERLAEKIGLDRPGAGIAFMMPFSAAASQFMTYTLFTGTAGKQQKAHRSLFGGEEKTGGGK